MGTGFGGAFLPALPDGDAMTHTYAEMEISAAAWDEIAQKLIEADYQHSFIKEDGSYILDMHGIGLTRVGKPQFKCTCTECGGTYLADCPDSKRCKRHRNLGPRAK